MTIDAEIMGMDMNALRFSSKILLAVCALCVGVGSFPHNSSEATRTVPDEAVGLIRQLEQADSTFLFDMHGNAMENLRRLEELRFRATSAIEVAIDRMEGDPERKRLVAALYSVLGFIKDPASTTWLRKKLVSQRSSIYAYYLHSWHDRIGIGFGNNEGFGGWPWLTGRERWIAFFIEAHDRATSEPRVLLMNILKGFDDPPVVQFFETQRKTAQDPREILLVQAYFRQHDRDVDEDRVLESINALKDDPANRPLLLGTADALRDAAFVPYLIETLDVAAANVSPPEYHSLAVLRNTTFQLDIENNAAWQSWYAKHQAESRSQWVQSAIASFKTLLLNDPSAAQAWFLEKAAYHWNDLDALSLVRNELLPRADFHSAIAGWINMTYTEFRRPRLKKIADELAQYPDSLENWAKTLLTERGFLPVPHKITWDQYVAWSNIRI